jgi:methyl-accepting chemotaxis protein
MTTKAATKLSESLTRKQLMQLELLIASVVPAVAILVVGVAGTAVNFNWFFVTLDVLACAIAVFFGERTIILRMQHALDEQLTDLITACREFIKGNTQLRVSMPGDDQLAVLASTLNSLFDHTQTTANAPKEKPEAREAMAQTVRLDQTSEELDLLQEQLEQLVDDISPALDGDLRVQSYVAEDTSDESVAMVADLCNALVEKLVQFTRWTLYASDRVISTSRNVLDRSIELAQSTETQMLHLSQMTAAVEKLVAFIQRMGSALQLSVDMAQEAYAHLQENSSQSNPVAASSLLKQLVRNTQRQMQLLEEILESTHNTTTIAESAIGDLYTFAQQFHQSSTAIIKTAESINSIVTIAEDWRNAADALYLPDDEEQEDLALEDNRGNVALPSPETQDHLGRLLSEK